MRSISKARGIKNFVFPIIFLMIVNISNAGDLILQNSEKPIYKQRSKWSISIYIASAFGGPGDKIGNQMRNSGFNNPSIRFSSSSKYSFLTKFRPQSWMVQLNYRMTKPVGLGLLYSSSLLDGTNPHTIESVALSNRIGFRIQVRTFSTLLAIYLNEYIVLGIGPSYNMTDAPSNKNKLGFIAHLNIRIPLSNSFSISGICQYYHIAGTTIGPYTIDNSDDTLTPNATSTIQIFPPTEISYSHLFIGLGVGIHFLKK